MCPFVARLLTSPVAFMVIFVVSLFRPLLRFEQQPLKKYLVRVDVPFVYDYGRVCMMCDRTNVNLMLRELRKRGIFRTPAFATFENVRYGNVYVSMQLLNYSLLLTGYDNVLVLLFCLSFSCYRLLNMF